MDREPTSGRGGIASGSMNDPVAGALHFPGRPYWLSSLQTYGSRCHTCPCRAKVEPRLVPNGLVIRIRASWFLLARKTGVTGSPTAIPLTRLSGSALLYARWEFGTPP
jgi:hypothetical protein